MSESHMSELPKQSVELIRVTLEDMRKHGLTSGLPQEHAFTLLEEIDRLKYELKVQKTVVDLAYIPHRNLVDSRDHVIAERDRLRSALRKALNVWHNYRIDSTEDERAIEAECRALVDDHSDSISPEQSK